MKISKTIEIEIDMEVERSRINNVEYTPEEKLALLRLCELFEAGEFEGARTLISYWDESWLEYINVEMWDILNESKLNSDYKIEKINRKKVK